MSAGSDAEEVYAELLARVGEARPRPRIEPVRRLAELAGSPQLDYPVIHIAGTNGKTSTARAVEALLRAHGLKTGLFTSPHLIDFTERFAIDGAPIAAHALAEAWDELRAPLMVADRELAEAGLGPITFFEALAVLAFAAFSDAPVEVAVIETGMGGEWDATNIVDSAVSVFTPIDLDHTSILGDSLAEIAQTKAGIITPNSMVITAAQHPAAADVLRSHAAECTARIFEGDRDFRVLDDRLAVAGRQLELQGITGHRYDPVFLPLHGQHQSDNAAVAVAAVEAFLGAERAIPDETLESGFAQLTSPGRLQLIGTNPTVYVDAAHNPHGAEALARAVTESFAFGEVAVVFGAVEEKDTAGIIRAIAPIADRILLTGFDSERSVPPEQLEQQIAELHRAGGETAPTTVFHSLASALENAREWAGQDETRAVLVMGSVLLAGQAIAVASAEEWGIA